MNRPLRRVALGVLILLGALIANLSYLQAFQADKLNQRNPTRAMTQVYSTPRGSILVNGQPVAYSTDSEGRFRYQRVYANGPLYAPATGYLSLYDAAGIERAENDVLVGDDIRQQFRRFFSTSTQGKNPGGNVELTLDPRLQQAAGQALGSRRGAVVALEPSTGAILAMVTSPSYDPNQLATHNIAQQTQLKDRLSEKDSTQPMLNRALNQTYPPGSTFKLVVASAAIEDKGLAPDSEVPGPAQLDLPQTQAVINNASRAQCTPGSDTTTLRTALVNSCNTTFAQIGMDQVGLNTLKDQAEAYGFNQTFQVPMGTAPSVFPTRMSKASTAQSSIGQFEVRATPLQMAMVAAAIANDGQVMKPYLVSRTTSAGGATLSTTRPQNLNRAISSDTATKLREMMVDVVANGTGTRGQVPGFTVAGKTGTAQWRIGSPNHAWFVGFAPAGPGEQPSIAVAVVVEAGGGDPNMSNDDISGGRLAAPIAKAVMEAKLQ